MGRTRNVPVGLPFCTRSRSESFLDISRKYHLAVVQTKKT
ncbi:unnamed protein product [Hydatigera taeniaeformis]|uniref:Uncharacterized protein n=1 Tax=Hydatigena taeniaeformis TaxID=6205 RepID=A0A3P7FF64_HYDTA|nr:unnamed protein product [Hydatigera taeniaeformis]